MKRLALVLIVTILSVSSCSDSSSTVPESDSAGITVDNAFYYTHVNGHKEETQKVAFILFEYEQLASVKYQVAYIACTCRGPEVNYWSVAYVELSKSDGSVNYISWDKDSSKHYTAGLYGDSVVTYEGVPAKDLLDQFTKDNIEGKSPESIQAYETMHGEVDAYTGATVTPNNVMRMMQGLVDYHGSKYL